MPMPMPSNIAKKTSASASEKAIYVPLSYRLSNMDANSSMLPSNRSTPFLFTL